MALAAVLALAGAIMPARAETDQVRIAQPYGLLYLPSYIAVEKQMIERHARELGLPSIKVSMQRLASGPAASDLVLSGNADLSMGGVAPLMLLWDKTRGTAKIRGVMTLCDSPVFFVTADPHIQTIKDFGEKDRIAVSAVKVTLQAIYLQMAAAKAFGWEERFKLDPLTVSMSNPDGMTALIAGGSEVRTHATILPFNLLEVATGKARQIFTSDDVLGQRSPGTALFAPSSFRDGSPTVYKAVVAAFEEAIDLANDNKREAAEIYLKYENTHQTVEEVIDILSREADIRFTSTPHGVYPIADFMYRVGTLKNRPESWRELFWENVHDKQGS